MLTSVWKHVLPWQPRRVRCCCTDVAVLQRVGTATFTMAGVRQRRPSVYDFTVETVDPPRRDARGIRENPGEDIEASLVRPCKPRPVSLGAFHNNVLVVVLMGRNSELSKDHFTQLIHLEKKYQQRGARWTVAGPPVARKGLCLTGSWACMLVRLLLVRGV